MKLQTQQHVCATVTLAGLGVAIYLDLHTGAEVSVMPLYPPRSFLRLGFSA
jgi:hypothetical protein